MERLLGNPERLGDLWDALPLAEHPLGLPQLANDLLRRVPTSLHQSSLLAHHRGRKKHAQFGVHVGVGAHAVRADGWSGCLGLGGS